MITSNLDQARQAAKQLLPYLPQPSLFSVARRAGIALPNTPLFAKPTNLPIKSFPAAVFDLLGTIGPKRLPRSWVAPYQQWLASEKRAASLRQSFEHWAGAKANRTSLALQSLDPCTAGVLVLAEGTQNALGRSLFKQAVTDAAGAFVAAHAPDLKRQEVERVLEALCSEPELLFWLGHGLPQYGHAAYLLASVCDGLHAALAAAQTTNHEWVDDLVRRTRNSPAASSVALILLPRGPSHLRERWLSNVSTSPRRAYETVRWSQHTWPGGRWLELRERLGTETDKGCWWYHWHRDVKSVPAAYDYTGVDPLWCAELMADMGLPTLPSAMRERLWSELTLNRTNREATLLLRWCQTRKPQLS